MGAEYPMTKCRQPPDTEDFGQVYKNKFTLTVQPLAPLLTMSAVSNNVTPEVHQTQASSPVDKTFPLISIYVQI